ncbi:MAG: hypothetical protein JXA21_07160 [Anaerolineae bacterium]|nr:hypothetical protein [Anaerolineae bacterium]
MNNKRFSVLLGALLIVIGGFALMANLTGWLFDWGVWWWVPWRLWPLLLIVIGLFFVVPPITSRNKPGLSGLFVPGLPILATGGISLLASVFNAWGVWARLWPLEVLSVALAFLLMAFFMRNIWLLIPAIIVGANGLLFQFCAFTGWWGIWAVMWTIEPLAVGLALLAVYLGARKKGLLIAGLILCGVAFVGMTGMAAIMPGWGVFNLFGPLLLILTGLVLLFVRGRPQIVRDRGESHYNAVER